MPSDLWIIALAVLAWPVFKVAFLLGAALLDWIGR